MDDPKPRLSLSSSDGWVVGILFPALLCGIVGGFLTGGFVGWLLAPPHHYFETIVGSFLVGAILGFFISWLGAITVGVVRFFVRR
jgi:hypothetical protein